MSSFYSLLKKILFTPILFGKKEVQHNNDQSDYVKNNEPKINEQHTVQVLTDEANNNDIEHEVVTDFNDQSDDVKRDEPITEQTIVEHEIVADSNDQSDAVKRDEPITEQTIEHEVVADFNDQSDDVKRDEPITEQTIVEHEQIKKEENKQMAIYEWLIKMSKQEINQALIDEFFTELQKHKEELQFDRIQKLNLRKFVHGLIHIIGTAPTYDKEKFYKNLFLIEKLGFIGKDYAIATLFHQITGLDYGEDTQQRLIKIKDKTDEDSIYEFMKNIHKRRTDQVVNPPSYCKKDAMAVLIKLNDDTRSLATIGFCCLFNNANYPYEKDSEVRIWAIDILQKYASQLKGNFRAENPSIIISFLTRTKEDPEDKVRSKGVEALSAVAKHCCGEVIALLMKRREDEENDGIRANIDKQIQDISALCPESIVVTMKTICTGLFDPNDDNRKKAIENLFLVSNWEAVIKFLDKKDILFIFHKLAKFINEEKNETVKSKFLTYIYHQDGFLFFALARDDKKDIFINKYKEQIKLSNRNMPDVNEMVNVIREGLKRLIDYFYLEILNREGFYNNAIYAVRALSYMCNRSDSYVRELLIKLFKHFELMGQTFEDDEFEAAIDPAGFANLPCKGGACVLKENHQYDYKVTNKWMKWSYVISNVPDKSIYRGSEDTSNDAVDFVFITFHPNCKFTLSTKSHVSGNFFRNSCLVNNRGNYTRTSGTFSISNQPGMFDFSGFLSKVKDRNRIFLSQRIIHHIRTLKHYEQLANLLQETFKTVYQKQPTDADINKLLPQADPERELIMEVLKAMKVLSVSDVGTQEFLFDLLGKDDKTRHWHEKTRIEIIYTIAEIPRCELLPDYENRDASYNLTLIQGRNETDAVKKAADEVRMTIKCADNDGGEMMLAPNQGIGDRL